MIYAYIRVSTDKQTVENQRFEINRFAKQRDFQIDVWVEETVSGTRSAKDRKLGVLLNLKSATPFPKCYLQEKWTFDS